MPGILPMKVIKVGGCSNNQTRIAQACDRCRSKKIRCDGIRPSCTQCLTVGFECKTSDKLSRRAFPRGYTESLEERVRALETEVRELKDLLDEKDEKIDLLSRLHPHSSPAYSISRQFPLQSPPLPTTEGRESPVVPNDTFKVQQSPLLSQDDNGDSYFVGMSSGRMLVDAFQQRVLESGRSCTEIHPDVFFHSGAKTSKASTSASEDVIWKAPPRLASDQMINIFFQEWAPLFPVIHRPTFLESYAAYTADPEAISDMHMVAQLNLVFGIAALSSPTRDNQEIRSIESQWHKALESCMMENSLPVLQNLVLAQIHCMLSGDYSRLLKYKGLAITLAHRLGLHQSQKRHPMDALTSETRKKVFWTLYTIDCLCAAHLGLPKLLQEDEIRCEYPVDADDDYVTEKGFLPILPGETTKLSAGLALFRACRILAKVLDQLYPSSSGNEVSFQTIATLSEELDAWSLALPTHLRLHFAQDKPSTNVTGSRSPILSLFFHFTRSLIFRPAVCANLGDKSSSAVLNVAQSAKSIVQIVQLLNERSLSFSFPMNQNELLSLSGFGLLFQTMNADHQGKLMKDCQRMVCIVIDLLEKGSAPCAPAFRRLGCTILTAQRKELRQTMQQPSPPQRQESSGEMPAPPENALRATQRHLKALASRLPGLSRSERDRRSAVPQATHQPNHSAVSVTSIRSEPPTRSEPRLSPPSGRSSISNDHNRQLQALHQSNLDFLSFDRAPVPSTYNAVPHSSPPLKPDMSPNDWERLIGNMDHGNTNIYDTIYGGPQFGGPLDLASSDASWSPEMWNMCMAYGNGAPQMTGNPGAQSVLSFSDESLTSGEEFAGDFHSVGSGGDAHFPGVFLQDLSPGGVKAEEHFQV